MFVKFQREARYEPRGVTKRRLAAAKSKFKKELEALPLFAAQIAEEQPHAEDYVLSNDSSMIAWDRKNRKKIANNWRRARAMLKTMPDDVKNKLIMRWNNSRWLPKKSHYFLDMIHTHFKEYYIEDIKKAA